MAATRETARDQRPPPHSSMLQRRDTGLGYPQHYNEESNSTAAPSTPFGPLLQPENITTTYKSFPPIYSTSLSLP